MIHQRAYPLKPIVKYGIQWGRLNELDIEAHLCRYGGKWKYQGQEYGEGYKAHFKRLVSQLYPGFDWNVYSETMLDAWCNYQYIGVAGPASTGKTYTMAMFAYATFVVWPQGTSIILSSTTLESLRKRVWAALVDIVRRARKRYPYLPGHFVESRHIMFAKPPNEEELRDPCDAIFGVACKVGGKWEGLANYVGIKNERVYGIFDEANFMPRSFWDATSNLAKNPDTKFVAMGNPTDRYCALGVICEPSRKLGGWEGYNPRPGTRTWETTRPRGIAVQLSGLDTPNAKYTRGLNPFPYFITLEQIEHDREYYGEGSWQFQAMNLGVFPPAESSKRVITYALADANNATAEPVWRDDRWTDYVGADLAYSFEEGDRSCLVQVRVGYDPEGEIQMAVVDGPVVLVPDPKLLKDGKPVPLETQLAMQVVDYCKRHGIPPHRFGYDSTGRGTFGVQLAALWEPGFHPIEFGGAAPDRPCLDEDRLESEKYTKMVSALWFAWRSLVVAGRMRGLPRSIIEEGAMREYLTQKTSGREDVEPKAATRKRMGRSPDAADALVAAIETARRNGFTLQRKNAGLSDERLRKLDQGWRHVLNRLAICF